MSVGQTKDAGWQIGVSKTVGRSAEEVWEFLTSEAGVAIWLGEGVTVHPEPGTEYETADGIRGETRSFRELDRIRLTWQPAGWTHETTLQLAVRASGPDKAMLRIHQERLANAAEREQQRRHWQGVLAELITALA
ncbi:SRPBCC domain-containing protein [Amycolatopsis orientalis]|uniref:SRPBCC domain-containing protein n=1 Tax=Amycolatopsis orientalis TaxID=31958 RepID=UPI0003A30652|nr:SRPBCC domain-containing protein [Amycolatopsis orientalis]